jgi:hypothetical protein
VETEPPLSPLQLKWTEKKSIHIFIFEKTLLSFSFTPFAFTSPKMFHNKYVNILLLKLLSVHPDCALCCVQDLAAAKASGRCRVSQSGNLHREIVGRRRQGDQIDNSLEKKHEAKQ